MAVPGANAQVASGPDLPEIATNALGFKTVAGEVKVRLPIKWDHNSLPPTSSSLLAVSSNRGLIAAAGEEGLFLSSTDSIRIAFKSAKEKDEIVTAKPDFALSLPRLSQVCFTSDASCLIVSGQQGGGLGIYSTQALLNKEGKPAFELPTDGISVRSLVPNPESPHLVAVVLANGHLMIANLQERAFAKGANGTPSLKDGVSCVAWSVRGKQLAVGLQDGSAAQIDPTGAIKALIPRAPHAPSEQTVSSILWLGNDDFFLIYSTPSPEPETPPESFFYWVRTDKGRSKFEFRKATDPSFAIHTRPPVVHYTARIRKWSQLEDVIFTASTASSDIGVITNSQEALTSNMDASEITNTYTVTAMEDDSRRAALPMSTQDDMQDTFPIGMALDLSSRDKVYQPIPGDDTITGDSPHPLPELMVLNAEGILSCWWFVNDAGIRKADPCPGLVAVESTPKPATFSPNPPVASPPATSSPFAAAKLNLGGLSQSSQPSAFGQSGFGQKPAAPAFGGTSVLGNSQSPWSNGAAKTTAPTFGAPSFGAPSAIGGSSFGSSNTVGQNKSVWGASQAPAANTSQNTASPFGSMSGTASGFAKLGSSTASPFGGLGNNSQASSPFGQSTPAFGNTPMQSFGSTVSIGSAAGGSTIGGRSVFGGSAFPSLSSPQTSSIFGQQQTSNNQAMNSGSNGMPSAFTTPFKLNSSFAPASSAKELDMEDEPSKTPTGGLHLGNLGMGLLEPQIKREESPKKSLFDIPTMPKDGSPQSQASSELQKPENLSSEDLDDVQPSIEHDEDLSVPEPPQVTSKPIPSPLTTAPSSATNSLQSSSALEQPKEEPIPEDARESSLPPSTSELSEDAVADEEDEEDENDENEPPQSPEISEPPSVASTPPRGELETPELTAQSILGSAVKTGGWNDATKFTRTPVVSSPLAQKPITALRNESTFGSSPGIPPPVPTPPVAGGVPRTGGLFGSIVTNSTTPQGLPQPPFKFSPPNQQESPRSPSPVRQPINGSGMPVKPFIVKKSPTPHQEETQTITQALVPIQPPEPVLASLRDGHHDYVQNEILARPPSPVLDLPRFISSHREHADMPNTSIASAVGSSEPEMEGLPGNIERVFRDINSMVDTLGLNARALSAFIRGQEHEGQTIDEDRHTEALLHSLETSEDDKEELAEADKAAEWTLDDLEKLPFLEGRLQDRLNAEKMEGLLRMIGEVGSLKGGTRVLKGDVKKMRVFLASKRAIVGDKDSPSKSTSSPHKYARSNGLAAPIPLDPAWASLQRDLRTKLAEYRTLLADAEEKLTITRAKLATRSAAGGKSKGPTVEAVESTIRRMTSMAEKRSGDLDVLELQMKKLGLIGANGTKGRISNWKRASIGLSASSSGVGKTFGVPDEEDDEDEEEHLTIEELEMRERVRRAVDLRKRRKAVLGKLKDERMKLEYGIAA